MARRSRRVVPDDSVGPVFIKPWVWELRFRTVVGGRWVVTLNAYSQDGQQVEIHREWEGAAGNTAQRDKDLVMALAMFDKLQEVPPLIRPLALLGDADKKALKNESDRVIKDVDQQLGAQARQEEALSRQPEPSAPEAQEPAQPLGRGMVWVTRADGSKYQRRARRWFKKPGKAA